MKAADIPGLEIAIFNGGKVAYLKSYGLGDTDKALTVNSVMSAASFTKVTFAYLVLKLMDDGMLDLDKPVYEYLAKPLPEYPNFADLANEPNHKRITARMLLDHTSGFPNWRWFEDDRRLKIHFEPGSKYAYSGEGIDLLSAGMNPNILGSSFYIYYTHYPTNGTGWDAASLNRFKVQYNLPKEKLPNE
jgi:CubicO group peptidase (beta-lactamase class C family)